MSEIAFRSLEYNGVDCSIVGNFISLPSYNIDDTGLIIAAVPVPKNSRIYNRKNAQVRIIIQYTIYRKKRQC